MLNRRHRALIVIYSLSIAIASFGGCAPAPEELALVPLVHSRIQVGSTPLTAWRFATAQTITKVLARQGDTVAILQPSTSPQPAEVLMAALALRSVRTYDLTGQRATGARRSGVSAIDPMFATWLSARLLRPVSKSTASADVVAVTRRLYELSSRVRSGDGEAAALYLLGLEVLDILGSGRPEVVNTPQFCTRLAHAGSRGNIVDASAWLGLVVRSGLRCPQGPTNVALSLAERRLESLDGSVSVQAAAEIRGAVEVVKLLGGTPSFPRVCRALLEEDRPDDIRVVRITLMYMVCADALSESGAKAGVSADVISWLDSIVLTNGRFLEWQFIDVTGLLYEIQILRSLEFHPDIITAAQATNPTGDPSDPVRSAMLAFARGNVPSVLSEAPAKQNMLRLDDQSRMLIAAGVLAGGQCPRWPEQVFGVALSSKHSTGDIDELFRLAVIAKGLRKCRGGLARDAETRILAELDRIVNPDGTVGKVPEVLDTWKAQEIRCLSNGRPQLTEATLLKLLPDYSLSNPRLDLAYDRLHASVRLSEIVVHGCGGAFWEIWRVP